MKPLTIFLLFLGSLFLGSLFLAAQDALATATLNFNAPGTYYVTAEAPAALPTMSAAAHHKPVKPELLAKGDDPRPAALNQHKKALPELARTEIYYHPNWTGVAA